MKPLYEYLNPRNFKVVVPEYDLKAAPLQLGKKIYNTVDESINGPIKDSIISEFGKWFEKNRRRRNVVGKTDCNVTLYITDEKNKLLINVLSEMERIGVQNMGYGEVSCGMTTIEVVANTYNQFKENTYTYNLPSNSISLEVFFKENTSGNGYNDLPAADMNILRRKFYDCMVSTTCEVLELESHKFSGSIVPLPRYQILLRVQYDNRKLKEFLNYLKNDNRLQNFAKRMDDINKGISSYYVGKHFGNYVGD